MKFCDVATESDDMNINIVVEGIAKDAAEASGISTDEAAKVVHEEAAKGSAGEAGKETGDRTDGIPASGAPGAT